MRKAIVIPVVAGVAIGAIAYINRDKIRKEVRKIKQSVADAKAFADLMAQPAGSPVTPGAYKPTPQEATDALNEVLAELKRANAIPNTMCRP